jgi:ubiquinone/menaquinone biosynthesis C-methylase UbiE
VNTSAVRRRAALDYHRVSVPFLLAPWLGDLFAAATPQAGDRVLDLACGTGLVAQHAAAFVGPRGRVVGADIDPLRLAVARRVQPVSSVLRWRQADAMALPFRRAAFDLAFCNQGLQFVADPGAALRELRRVLKRGGRVVAAVWNRIDSSPYYAAIGRGVGRSFGPDGRAAVDAAFALGESGALARLMSQAGLREVVSRTVHKALALPEPERFLPAQLAAGAVAERYAAASPAARAALVADILVELGPHRAASGALIAPFEVHLVSALA